MLSVVDNIHNKMSKKTRGPNFTSHEKEILVHLITKYKDIVENKKTDAVTTAIKNEGWKKLAEEFNCLSSFHVRNVDQLKTCWDNIKRTTRKDKAATKKNIFLTGGGRPDIPPPGPLQGQVEVLLGPTLDGLDNPYDSDIYFSDQELLNSNTLIEVINEKDDIEAGVVESCSGSQTVLDAVTSSQTFQDATASSQIFKDATTSQENNCSGTIEIRNDIIPTEDVEKKKWNTWTPKVLKTKVSNTLLVYKENSPSTSTWLHRRRPKSSLQDKVLQSKLELIENMLKNTQKEAALKEQILEEQLKQEKLRTEKLELEIETMKKKLDF